MGYGIGYEIGFSRGSSSFRHQSINVIGHQRTQEIPAIIMPPLESINIREAALTHEELAAERTHSGLAPIAGYNRVHDHIFSLDAVNYLNINLSVDLPPNHSTGGGSINIFTHDRDYIVIHYNLHDGSYILDGDILTFSGSSGILQLFVPHSHHEPIFERLNITISRGLESPLFIIGDTHLTYLTENLYVHAYADTFGFFGNDIIIENIMVSNDFIVSLESGNINLRNVLANNDRVDLRTQWGQVIAYPM